MQARESRVEDRRVGHSLSFVVGLAAAAGQLDIATGALMMLEATVAFEHREFKGQRPN
jgi:hypothetical protein